MHDYELLKEELHCYGGQKDMKFLNILNQSYRNLYRTSQSLGEA